MHILLSKKISIFLVFISLFFSACQDKKTNNQTAQIKKESIAVNVHTLKKETYPIWVTFSGKTQALNNVAVTSRISGELKKILFTPGQNVKKGQILFEIDKRKYKSIYDQKNAILQKDKASLKLAKANVNRYKPLIKEQLAPKEKLEQLIAKQKQIEANIKADKASLDNAKLNLEYCDIKASIDGKIGKSLISKGNNIVVGSKLAQIVQTNSLYVNINPSVQEAAAIQQYKSEKNPKVIVQFDRGDDEPVEFQGKIDFIDNVSNDTTGTVAIRAKITNEKNLLYPGVFVKLKMFISDKIPLIAVNPNQIAQNQQGQYVYVVNKQNIIKTRQILSNYSTNKIAVVDKGLKEGDRVIVGSSNNLHDGMKVIPSEVPNPIVIK